MKVDVSFKKSEKVFTLFQISKIIKASYTSTMKGQTDYKKRLKTGFSL